MRIKIIRGNKPMYYPFLLDYIKIEYQKMSLSHIPFYSFSASFDSGIVSSSLSKSLLGSFESI